MAWTCQVVEDGDSALVVDFEERIDQRINARVVAVSRAIEASAIPGVRDVVPAIRSLTVYFDPLVADRQQLLARLEQEARGIEQPTALAPFRLVRVPVCYGGKYGPDIGEVAAFAGVDEAGVVALHSAVTYRVFMLGFVPGFAYLASVDPRIAAPRLATPRTRVPAGSVGIAGEQTGVYPSETPGGWRLIGRTPIVPFDVRRQDPFLFNPGDGVQFYPIEPADFERARAASGETM